MEIQINKLETHIEKMQEMFNNNLEIKNSQSVVNNAIFGIKTLWRGPTIE